MQTRLDTVGSPQSHESKHFCPKQIRDLAKPYMGWPFAEHGRDISGVDCFGLFMLLAADMGVVVEDWKYEWGWLENGENHFEDNYRTYANKIKDSDRDAGSIVLFDGKKPGIPSHIGIMINRDEFVHGSLSGVSIGILSRGWIRQVHAFYEFKRPD